MNAVIPTSIVSAVAWVTLALIAFLGGTVILEILRGKIDLSRLVSEPSGDASMSRFQLLIFTFVIALSLFLVIAGGSPPAFPDIPPGILTLLGISASSYLVSKGIQFSKVEGIEDRPPQITINPPSPTVGPGGVVVFEAEVHRLQDTTVQWEVSNATYGSVDQKGRFKAADQIPVGGASVTVRAISVANGQAVGTAVVSLIPRSH